MGRLRTLIWLVSLAVPFMAGPAGADDEAGRVVRSPAQVMAEAAVLPLPPDPGEAGKATLGGIDSDGDSLRDDIQRYIAFTFPNSARVRAAAAEYAKTVQQSLFVGTDQVAAMRTARAMGRARRCMQVHIGVESYDALIAAQRASSDLRAEVLNTAARSRAYLAYDAQLAGGIFHSPPKSSWRELCVRDFDALRD